MFRKRFTIPFFFFKTIISRKFLYSCFFPFFLLACFSFFFFGCSPRLERP
jgi:hypothetical protein